MQRSSSFKQSLLSHMLVGLRVGGASGSTKMLSTDTILMERKEVVKVSADVAMAFARGGARWSNALISDIYSGKERNKLVVRSMVGARFQRLFAKLKECRVPRRRQPTTLTRRMFENKRILKRSRYYNMCMRRKKGSFRSRSNIDDHHAKCLARSITKKRLGVLKRLVPGGEAMDDELSFLGETIDYIVSLRAQVDVMRSMARSVDLSKSNFSCSNSCRSGGVDVDRE